jgi:hypothetical protein
LYLSYKNSYLNGEVNFTLFIVILNVLMLNVIMLNVFMLSVIMLNGSMLSVVGPLERLSN